MERTVQTMSFFKVTSIIVFFLSLAIFVSYGYAVEQTAVREQDLINQESVTILVQRARALSQEGKLLEAQKVYRNIITPDASGLSVSDEIRREFEDINLKIIFSRLKTDNCTFYTVKSGDSLYKIAKKYGTTIELIKKSNGLSSSTIYPDDTLKVITASFSIFVDKSDNTLQVKLNDRIVKTYTVATGKDNNTPVGLFTIRDKLIDPTWYHAGAIVPPDSAENILGTRWMGFNLRGYGIHGTTMPETIGSQSTAGCVRMFNRDVEEVYSLIPVGIKVVIID
ncbi:MAG: L,D-transpeptidase family protein [Candidatus Omnitrophota bacterium]